jgi:hypothetical protein
MFAPKKHFLKRKKIGIEFFVGVKLDNKKSKIEILDCL